MQERNQCKVLEGFLSLPYIVSARSEIGWPKGVKLGEGRNKAAPTLHTDIFSIIKIPKTYFTLLISGFLETRCDYITSIVLTGVETEKALNEESVWPIPFVTPNTDIIPLILNFPSIFTNTSTRYKSSKQENQVFQHTNAAT